MIHAFTALRGLLKTTDGGVRVDNWVFRAHYKLTAAILFGCSLLVTSRQYFGDPIYCVADGVPRDVLDAYCWTHSTFTVDSAAGGQDHASRYHDYYQWVGLALFLQALAFCAPRFAWALCEGGLVDSLVGADDRATMVPAHAREARKKLLLEYFAANSGSAHHRWYAVRFFACELLNAANAVAQALFMDLFFGGQFAAYGAQVLRHVLLDRGRGDNDGDDPMSRVFPKTTKCTFRRFGQSGTVQTYDGLCVLALNAVNEKIFVFLWFYLHGLIAVSACALIYRLFALTVPRFRAITLHRNARRVPRSRIDVIVREYRVGDWFVLQQVRDNVNEFLFGEFLCELADYVDSRHNIVIVALRGRRRW